MSRGGAAGAGKGTQLGAQSHGVPAACERGADGALGGGGHNDRVVRPARYPCAECASKKQKQKLTAEARAPRMLVAGRGEVRRSPLAARALTCRVVAQCAGGGGGAGGSSGRRANGGRVAARVPPVERALLQRPRQGSGACDAVRVSHSAQRRRRSRQRAASYVRGALCVCAPCRSGP